MARKYLLVIDMQNDFVNGALGTPEAQAIVEAVAARARDFDGTVVFTRDTHGVNYLETQEGKNLPVTHCVAGTPGWELAPAIAAVAAQLNAPIFDKPTFGSVDLAEWLAARAAEEPIDSIELAGLCTDICVVSNALMVKAFLPEVPVAVDASLCAGVTPASHEAALATMRSCQVQVID